MRPLFDQRPLAELRFGRERVLTLKHLQLSGDRFGASTPNLCN